MKLSAVPVTLSLSFAAACGAPHEAAEPAVVSLEAKTSSATASAHASTDGSAKPSGRTISEMLNLGSARVRAAFAGAQAAGMAAQLEVATGDPNRCPAIETLVANKKIDPDHTKDPWGHPFRILCDERGPHGLSDGADGIEGTADDIRDDATPSDLERINAL